MAREIKSLLFNLEDERDIPRHREHRSKKGRNCWNRENSPVFMKYKNQKWRKKYEDDDELLQNFR